MFCYHLNVIQVELSCGNAVKSQARHACPPRLSSPLNCMKIPQLGMYREGILPLSLSCIDTRAVCRLDIGCPLERISMRNNYSASSKVVVVKGC